MPYLVPYGGVSWTVSCLLPPSSISLFASVLLKLEVPPPLPPSPACLAQLLYCSCVDPQLLLILYGAAPTTRQQRACLGNPTDLPAETQRYL